jgi:glycosyltransferase involved in cell wall biosynthesis
VVRVSPVALDSEHKLYGVAPVRGTELHHSSLGAVAREPSVEKARVAFVYGDYPPSLPDRPDGGSDFLGCVAEGLVRRGHQVTAVVSSRADRPGRFVSKAGVRVAPVIHDWSLRSAAAGELSAVRRVLTEDGIDLVHLIYPDPYLRYRSDSYHLPFLLKLARRRPLVITFFGFGVAGGGFVTRAGLLSLFAAANRVVITDADLLRRFRRTLPWWSGKARAGQVGSIAPPAAPTWSPEALHDRKAALGLNPAQRHIGFFGFWDRGKGIEDLLEAVHRLRAGGQDVVLVLIGGRPPAARLEYERGLIRLAEQLGIATWVNDTGPLSPEDVSRYMVAMDVCALPFKANPLGRSSLALALGLGIPTVVTRPPAEDAGLVAGLPLLDPPEPAQIERAIARLLEDPGAQRAAGDAASTAARHWSWDAIIDDYESLYAELVPRPR